MLFIGCDTPSSAWYSHWIGMSTSGAATSVERQQSQGWRAVDEDVIELVLVQFGEGRTQAISRGRPYWTSSISAPARSIVAGTRTGACCAGSPGSPFQRDLTQ